MQNLTQALAPPIHNNNNNRVSGLIPPVFETLELQAERVMYQLRTFATTPLQKYDQLAQLAATNLTLYYKVGHMYHSGIDRFAHICGNVTPPSTFKPFPL